MLQIFLFKSLFTESKYFVGPVKILATDPKPGWGQSQLVGNCFYPFLSPEKKEWDNPQPVIGLPTQDTHVHIKPLLVTGMRVLGFLKTEIERQLQRNFQMDFIKLMLEHKGGSTEERKVL